MEGKEAKVTAVDAFGRTPEGVQLERAFIYNGVFWAVWLHYFPEMRLVP